VKESLFKMLKGLHKGCIFEKQGLSLRSKYDERKERENALFRCRHAIEIKLAMRIKQS